MRTGKKTMKPMRTQKRICMEEEEHKKTSRWSQYEETKGITYQGLQI